MIPYYPYAELEIKRDRKKKRKPKPHPVWDVLHCLSTAISIGTVGTVAELLIVFEDNLVPFEIYYGVFMANFFCVLSIVFFFYLNPLVDNEPTND